MKRSFTLAFLLSLSLIYSYAQNWSLTLSSNVELRTWKLSTKADKEEKGLAGASIKLYKGGGLVNEVSSGANGEFQINIPANGEFMLEVSYAGCNTKRFAISTMNVPENIAKDNFKPRYGIGGFIMARPLPGIDYSYLKQPLVRVVYVSRGKFEDDNAITESSLKAVSKINDAENSLIEKFCAANREGDAALAKPDCPLAKILYEKALGYIPGEAYPAQQLTKVGKCLKDKEESDKKAKESAATAKQDADKKAVDDAVAKAKADKAAKDQEVQDQLVKAAEQEAKKKAAEEKKAAAAKPVAKSAEKPAETPKAVSSPQPTAGSDAKPKTGIIKPKEKSEEDLEAERRRAGKAKSEAEDAAAIREDAEKAEAKRKEKEKKYQENLIKEREEEQKKAEERRTKEKEQAEKEKQEQLKEAEEQRKKKEEAEQKEKEEAKKQAEEEAAEAQKAQEEREKEEAERKKKEDEQRKKTYEKIEKKYENGKSKSEYSIPPPLGSTNVYKDKITKADKLFNDKKYQEAKTVYEEALKAKPNDEYATAKLAEINKLLNP